MRSENKLPCDEAVRQLASNGPYSNAEIISALKNDYTVPEIQIAISGLFTGKNAGQFDLEKGTAKIKPAR